MSDQPSSPPPVSPTPPPPAGAYRVPPPPGVPRSAAARPKKSSSWPVITVVLVILFVVGGAGLALLVFIGGFASMGMGGGLTADGLTENEMEKGTSGQKVVVITVDGLIHSGGGNPFFASAPADDIVKQLHRVQRDKTVVAVILDLNTPGGEVTATDEIHHAIQKLRHRDAADGGAVEVVTCMRTVAASGGYYLAAGTDYIVANRLTLTGSIGVMLGNYNYYGLLEKLGVKSSVYHRGEFKDIGDPARDPSSQDPAVAARNAKDREILQGLVDETYNDFLKIVADGRKLPLETVKATPIGDSRVLSGAQALELKLVDELGYFEDAVRHARRTGEHKVVRYARVPSLLDLIGARTESSSVAAIGQLVPPELGLVREGRLYFLCPSLR